MFGITSSGCFVLGIIIGFILAATVGIACVFYFNPDFKHRAIEKVESAWGNVKSGVDSSIDTVKKAPVAEPEVPGSRQPIQPYRTQPLKGQQTMKQHSYPVQPLKGQPAPVKPTVTINF